MYSYEVDELFNKIFEKLSALSKIDNDILSELVELKTYIDARSVHIEEQQIIIQTLERNIAILSENLDSAGLALDDLGD